MGKRSDFTRIPRDFYPTPASAMLGLARHLPEQFSFIEPCAGDGRLVDHLSKLGGTCVFSADIEPRHPGILSGDILDQPLFWPKADYVITNPPWSRPLLHAIISLVDRPAWLLFDADWCHTQQSIPHIQYLRTIQSIGRVKWIPGSKHSGKDNVAWHLFDPTSPPSQPVFYSQVMP